MLEPTTLVAAAAALGLAIWRPTAAAALAILALAVPPQALLMDEVPMVYGWTLQHTLLAFVLLGNVVRNGLRTSVNWPVLALIASWLLNLLLGEQHRALSHAFMAASLAALALPWLFTQSVMSPGSRRVYAAWIAAAPAVSVAIGVVLDLAAIRPLFSYADWAGYYRIAGAIGDPEPLAILAFAGLAAALNESSRPGRRYAPWLMIVNLVIIILTGTRMAIACAGLLLLVYGAQTEGWRSRLRQHRAMLLIGAVAVTATVAVFWGSLQPRLYDPEQGGLVMSGRDQIWAFYLNEFLLAPILGHGIGAGFVLGEAALPFPRTTPHNEYLHLLVMTGLIGFGLIMTAIVHWYRGLLKVASDPDRRFLLALAPALAAYAFTADVLVYPPALALYLYLGTLLTAPGPKPVPGPAPMDARSGSAARGRSEPALEPYDRLLVRAENEVVRSGNRPVV